MRRQRLDQRAFKEGDHRGQWKAARGRWKVFFALFLGALWLPAGLAGEPAAPERSAWRVWVEPRFTHVSCSAPLPEAKRTELAAGMLGEDGLTPVAAWPAAWEEFLAQARENAAADLADVTTNYIRDSKKVIRYAELRSPHGLLASAVLSPKFLESFRDTLGGEIILLLPNRYTAYAFAKLASDYAAHADTVLEDYRTSPYPVSHEVFELGPHGLRAVGYFPDPRRD